MVEAFGKEIGRHLLNWSGWLFTVGGTMLALWLTKEHWWLSVLIVLTFAGAALTFSYQNHRQTQKAEERHQSEMNAANAREQAAMERLQEVERKLNEVPSEILIQLQRIIGQHSTSELGRRIIVRSELIARMKNFSLALNKPLNLRRFFREADLLFVAAKGATEAVAHLRVGDPFLLLRIGTDKLETRIAKLIVQQVAGLEEGVVAFRVTVPFGDEIQQIERLTESTEIAGMRGYRIIPALDLGGYPDVDLRLLAGWVNRTVQDLSSEAGD